MLHLLLVYENAKDWAALPAAEKRKISDDCRAWHERLLKSGHARVAMGLQPPASAATVRVRSGREVVTDGPFAETKEVLGGYELVDCKDRDEAIAIAKTFPALRVGFAVEVRPVLTDEEELQRWQEA